MMTKQPDAWLRGPVPGVPDLLQPVAHALIMSSEEIATALSDVHEDMLWARPSGAASVGFHLAHLAGSTDRLFTYARGEPLSEGQRDALAKERRADEERPELSELQSAWRDVVERALSELQSIPETTLTEPRFVGQAKLPSTVMGLLFHAAEHAARHTGQIVTTLRVAGGDQGA